VSQTRPLIIRILKVNKLEREIRTNKIWDIISSAHDAVFFFGIALIRYVQSRKTNKKYKTENPEDEQHRPNHIKTRRIQVLVKFLFLIRHPPCCSYSQVR